LKGETTRNLFIRCHCGWHSTSKWQGLRVAYHYYLYSRVWI